MKNNFSDVKYRCLHTLWYGQVAMQIGNIGKFDPMDIRFLPSEAKRYINNCFRHLCFDEEIELYIQAMDDMYHWTRLVIFLIGPREKFTNEECKIDLLKSFINDLQSHLEGMRN